MSDQINLYNDRRKDVLAHVEATGPEHFDMHTWLYFDNDEYPLEFAMHNDVNVYDCGTAACLAGHTAVVMRNQDAFDDYKLSNLMKKHPWDWEEHIHNDVITYISDWLGIDASWFSTTAWQFTGIKNIINPEDELSYKPMSDYDVITTALRSLIEGTYEPGILENTICNDTNSHNEDVYPQLVE